MRNIAIFIGQIHLDSQRKVILSIFEECKKHNINLHVYSFYSSTELDYNLGEFEYINRIDFENYDGFILYAETIYSTIIREKILDKIKNLDKNVVCIDYKIEEGKNVSSDNNDAMEELIRHLVEEHHAKKINFISGPVDSQDSNKRLSCTKKVLKEYGIDLPDKRIFVGDYYADSGNQAIEYYANNNLLDAEAYICANDQMAIGAYYELLQRGFKVPEDCMVTGFDNIDQAAYNIPGITSIKRNEEKLGKSAFEKLYNLSKDIKSEDIFIKATPVFRGSCCTKREELDSIELLKYYNRQIQINVNLSKYISLINDSTAEFYAANNVEKLCEIIPTYLEKFKINEFCLCLDNDKSSSTVDVPLHYVSGSKYSGNVDRNLVIPYLTEKDGASLSIIAPLHYMDKYFGYAVSNNFYLPLYDEVYKTFINNISNSLEAIYSYNELASMYKKLEETSKYDPLTGLYNRRGFFDEADELFDNSKKQNESMFIIFIDLDGLKSVNDNLGHKYGDMFLYDFADILRKVNEDNHLLTMRFGGDEFVIFSKITSKEEVIKIVDKINKLIDELNISQPTKYGEYKLGASIGTYEVNPRTPLSLLSLIDNADKQMYNEKRAKKSLKRL